MNQKEYFKYCKKCYLEVIGAVIVLCILTYLWLPIWVSFPLIMYELSSLAFNIGAVKSCYKPEETIELSKVE